TVQQAIDAYIDHLEGRASYEDTKLRLAAYVPDHMGAKEVAKLTKEDLVRWHKALARVPQRHRRAAVDLNDPEVSRKRKVSANRILGLLKASLNYALSEGHVASDRAWRTVKPFKGVNAARVRYLTVAESKRLVNAADPMFRPMVRAALETGARYSE